MDRFRYILALWCVALFPPAVLFWFVLHPFVDFWRRRGLPFTYAVLITGMLAMAYGLFLMRDSLLAVDYGFNASLALVGVLLVVAGSVFDKKAKDHLSFRTLVGVPELADPEEKVLLTEGIYARVRHPRYTGVILSVLGVTLVTNFQAMYALAVLSALGLWGVTILEERELLVRFGESYADYRRRVPRFFPRLRSR